MDTPAKIAVVTGAGSGIGRLCQAAHRPTAQPFELETVWGHDIRQRQRVVAKEFRDAGPDIVAEPGISHDRIAAEQRAGICLFDAGDDIEQHRAGLRFTEIAGQHSVAPRQYAQFSDPFEEDGDLARRDGVAAPFFVARMV